MEAGGRGENERKIKIREKQKRGEEVRRGMEREIMPALDRAEEKHIFSIFYFVEFGNLMYLM